jgi:hypothetical protein
MAITKISDDRPPLELKLERPKGTKVETIKAQVGSKTYSFLFDSGGGATVITPDVAQELGCKPLGRGTGFRSTGERLDGERCEDVSMKIGDYSTVTDTGIFNIMAFFDTETPPLGGIVSLQTFEDHPITLDLANNRLTVENEKSLAQRIVDMKPLRARLSRQSGGATVDVFVAANTPNGRIWLELDSGNVGPVFLAPHALKQLGVNLYAPNKARATKPVKLDLDGFGTIEPLARERDIIYDGQLNFDAISKMLVTIDVRTGRVWIKANEQQVAK